MGRTWRRRLMAKPTSARCSRDNISSVSTSGKRTLNSGKAAGQSTISSAQKVSYLGLGLLNIFMYASRRAPKNSWCSSVVQWLLDGACEYNQYFAYRVALIRSHMDCRRWYFCLFHRGVNGVLSCCNTGSVTYCRIRQELGLKPYYGLKPARAASARWDVNKCMN